MSKVVVGSAQYQQLLDAGATEDDLREYIDVADEVPGIDAIVRRARSLMGQRVSKHRAGRTPRLTKEQRRKRDRRNRLALQARKKLFLVRQAYLRALQAAVSHD